MRVEIVLELLDLAADAVDFAGGRVAWVRQAAQLGDVALERVDFDLALFVTLTVARIQTNFIGWRGGDLPWFRGRRGWSQPARPLRRARLPFLAAFVASRSARRRRSRSRASLRFSFSRESLIAPPRRNRCRRSRAPVRQVRDPPVPRCPRQSSLRVPSSWTSSNEIRQRPGRLANSSCNWLMMVVSIALRLTRTRSRLGAPVPSARLRSRPGHAPDRAAARPTRSRACPRPRPRCGLSPAAASPLSGSARAF